MSGWRSTNRWGSSIEDRRRERDQRRRDERAEASREYLADIAMNGCGCSGDGCDGCDGE